MKKLYKGISILLVLILFSLGIVSLSKPILAQDINWALTGVPSHANLYVTANNYLIWTLNDEKLNDNSISDKAVGLIASYYVRYQVAASFDSIIDFNETVSVLNRIEVVAGYENRTNTEMRLIAYVYYNGGWHEAGDTGTVYLSRAPSRNTYTFVSGAPWNNVEKIKIYTFFGCAPWQYIDHYLYEIRAFGEPPPSYIDIGLRVFNGTEVVSIAAEPTGTLTSPLRIAKNGVIYGIALVDPGDPNDSGVRIQTSSGIKALRRL